MRRAILLLPLIILCASFALAEVAVVTTTSLEEKETGFLIEETNSGVKIEAMTDVGKTYVYLNGELAEEFESLQTGNTESIRFDKSIENEIEIRFLKEYSYTWDNYDITKNEIPVELEYLKYDKDNKYVKFSLDGANIIHPNIIDTTKRSVEESLTEYTIKVDDEINLNCYPKITTGQNVYFKCKCTSYPHVIDITTTLGVSEKAIINASVVQTSEVSEDTKTVRETEIIPEEKVQATNDETETLVQEEDQENTSAPEETEVLDSISMTDTILESQGMSKAIKFLTLMLFLAIGVLFFVASHHKHENKKSGTHHPHKKKVKKK